MSEIDWELLDGSLDKAAEIDRGNATTVLDPDGNPTTYGFASRAIVTGAAGLYCKTLAPMSGTNRFNPTRDDNGDPRGGRIQGLVQRGPSGGVTGFAPMLFINLQGTATADQGYLLGLSDASPHYLVLRKGSILDGIPNSPVGTDGVLARGSVAHLPETWHQLRLDAVLNENGDVTLICRQSDIAVQGMEDPLWKHIPGIGESFIDDALGVQSASQPFKNGRMGFAFQCSDVARRAFFTRMTLYRQL